jgi:hypothetical protein
MVSFFEQIAYDGSRGKVRVMIMRDKESQVIYDKKFVVI